MAPHERLGQDEPGPIGEVERFVDLGRMAGVRLLAQDMLAGRQRAHRPGVVERVWQRDVDRLDVGILEQVVIRPVGAGDPVRGGERIRPGLGPAADRDDARRPGPRRAGKELGRDPAGPEDPPAEPVRSSPSIPALPASLQLEPLDRPLGEHPADRQRGRGRR